MSYYGESSGYYGGERPPYERPPYERPPYERPPYERPPYEEHRGSPYERPPYERPPYSETRSYDSRPPYSPAPPSARPPQYPPPPLPIGWIQEWEPSARRAFFVETSTGRAEWTLPAELSYGGGEGSRALPPPGGEYYASPPPPGPPAGYAPPQEGYGYPPQGEYEQKEKKSSDTGKLLAAGAAGLAIGGIGGAILGHELTEDSDAEEEAYEAGRRDQEEYDEGHHSGSEPHYSDYED
ncbi:hypothetical protein BDV18DRAFT_35031 [Aspergillus unguis]